MSEEEFRVRLARMEEKMLTLMEDMRSVKDNTKWVVRTGVMGLFSILAGLLAFYVQKGGI